ncbi:isocitrate/isopropylmalate dehydrogenase family protein [Streptococcus thermophilus]|uniref:isocitrate/isopropylmalate dehydrogenase family protein n=1 Tax=Streptococcus thermophilus TaxID=1308 RepID=UPI0021823EFD|nr:isocitrate/isopropylmalate family dehydrogenase [Streptococcus thermophilus]MCS8613503.1 isocitrate/isopropylmalate dehydrogenase family protein [Streptococcus thermophilus]
MKSIAVLPGDGIGIEVMEACVPIFKELNLDIKLKYGEIGWKCWINSANPVPNETWNLIKNCDAVLVGAITSKPKHEAEQELKVKSNNTTDYVSPVIQLRQKLQLFANVRPIVSLINNKSFEVYIIRENTEGLYSGLDFNPIPEPLENFINESTSKYNNKLKNGAATIRIITEEGFNRLLKFSSEWALKHGKSNIVIADKPNVFRNSSDIIFRLIKKYSLDYPMLNYTVENIDAVAMWLVKKPQKYEIVICENQFGDILSDVGAAVMGGLGLAYSGNYGLKETAYFEPVHGSAPKYSGQNKVNPMAMFLSIAMLLDFLGYKEASQSIQKAIEYTAKDKRFCTFDLSGDATLSESAKHIIEEAVKIYGNS